MRKIKLILTLFLFIVLLSCNGSDSYIGNWKALDLKDKKHEIIFSKDKIFIKDSTGKLLKQHNYIQTGNGHQGSSNRFIDTYDILLNNGIKYEIYFPKNDEGCGLIRYKNGENLYTISKTKYLTIDDINKIK